MKLPINSSTWISEILYRSIPVFCPHNPPCKECEGVRNSYLAIFTTSGQALLYRNVPSHIPGLLQAGLGGLSVGKAYNKLVKGKYEYSRVEGKEKVNELRKMMVL